MVKTLLENMQEDHGNQAADQPERSGMQKAAAVLHLFSHVGRKKMLIWGSAMVAVLAAATWFFLSAVPEEDKKQLAAHTIAPENLAGQDRKETMRQIMDETVFADIVSLVPFYGLPLKGGSSMAQVDMALSLELIDPAISQQIGFMTNRIHAVVQDQVKRVTWLELRTPEGKIQLKYNLLKQINALFSAPVVRNVYFTKFLMQ